MIEKILRHLALCSALSWSKGPTPARAGAPRHPNEPSSPLTPLSRAPDTPVQRLGHSRSSRRAPKANSYHLLTWNCTHIANAAISRGIEEICRERGIECPVICTPEELMGGYAMTRDPIVEEIRKNRQEIAARFKFDLKAIIADAQKRQRSRGKRLVSFVHIGKKKRA